LLTRLLLFTLISLFFASPSLAYGGDPWQELGIQRIEPMRAPDISLKDIDGKDFTLSSLKGKVVFLNFWATWCFPCTVEMPAMEQLYRKYREKGLVIAAVNHYEAPTKVKDFVEAAGYTFTVPVDPSGGASVTYRVRFLPVTYLIDKAGNLVGQVRGSRPWDSKLAFQLIEELIGE